MKEFVEKLIERLEEKHKCSEKDMLNSQIQYHQTVYGVQMNTYERVIEIVNQLAEEYVPETNVGKWIPCSDRLPEEELKVIVSTKTECIRVGIYTKRYGFGMREGFICDDGFMYINTANAWQPLPEPYKPEQPKQIPTDHYTERFNRVM